MGDISIIRERDKTVKKRETGTRLLPPGYDVLAIVNRSLRNQGERPILLNALGITEKTLGNTNGTAPTNVPKVPTFFAKPLTPNSNSNPNHKP
jgi:hypothetical protein